MLGFDQLQATMSPLFIPSRPTYWFLDPGYVHVTQGDRKPIRNGQMETPRDCQIGLYTGDRKRAYVSMLACVYTYTSVQWTKLS